MHCLQADEERAAAAAKKQFFTTALADMRLAQSKVNRAVVEAQQRCAVVWAASCPIDPPAAALAA